MRNHYHIALETPEANLVEGMHWLQSTFATRFNRFRKENGHLFQGRYQSLLVENATALFRVANYINLNPVRAGLVLPHAAATYRWGSLIRFVDGPRQPWLIAETVLTYLKLGDNADGWTQYLAYLAKLACDPKQQQQQQEFDRMSSGWAIGTSGWRRALAHEYTQMALNAGLEREQLHDLRDARWRDELHRILLERGLSALQINKDAQSATWKIEVAAALRRRVAAPYQWIAHALKIRHPANLRMQVHRRSLQVSA